MAISQDARYTAKGELDRNKYNDKRFMLYLLKKRRFSSQMNIALAPFRCQQYLKKT